MATHFHSTLSLLSRMDVTLTLFRGRVADVIDRAVGSGEAPSAPPAGDLAGLADRQFSQANPALDRRLARACAEGDIPAVRACLKAGADANARDDEGTPALILAMRCGPAAALHISGLLLDHNAEADARDRHTRTPLMTAAIRHHIDDHLKVAELLLDRGANPNARTAGDQPKPVLFHSPSHDMSELLVRRGADPLTMGPGQTNVLMHAAATGVRDAAQACCAWLDRGIALDAVNDQGQTALEIAHKERNKEAMDGMHAWRDRQRVLAVVAEMAGPAVAPPLAASRAVGA